MSLIQTQNGSFISESYINNGTCNDNEFHYNRATDGCYRRHIDNDDINSENCIDSENINTDKSALIYRFKFTQEFMDTLFQFSKIHQYDDRKSFKEAWVLWKESNEEIINAETRRLVELKYSGDILDKMFKSARYYFRKKNVTKPEPKERRQYVTVQKKLLDSMDHYIKENIDTKPSDSFIEFCENHKDDLREEVSELLKQRLDRDEIINKVKKTYKNRYFILVNK